MKAMTRILVSTAIVAGMAAGATPALSADVGACGPPTVRRRRPAGPATRGISEQPLVSCTASR